MKTTRTTHITTTILALLSLSALSLPTPSPAADAPQTVAAKLPKLPPKPATANQPATDLAQLLDAYIAKYTPIADQAIAASDLRILYDATRDDYAALADKFNKYNEDARKTPNAGNPWASYLQAAMMRAQSLTHAAEALMGDAQYAPAFSQYPPLDPTTRADKDATFYATFNAMVKARPAPTIRWQTSPDGATWTDFTNTDTVTAIVQAGVAASLSFQKAPATLDGMKYRCVATNPLGTTHGPTISLTVGTRPVITTQPRNLTVAAGAPATFQIAATGKPPPKSYQWQSCTDGKWWWDAGPETKNQATYTGDTTDTLTVTNIDTSMNGAKYRCLVENDNGQTVSDEATLTLTIPSVATRIPPAPPRPAHFTTPGADELIIKIEAYAEETIRLADQAIATRDTRAYDEHQRQMSALQDQCDSMTLLMAQKDLARFEDFTNYVEAQNVTRNNAIFEFIKPIKYGPAPRK